MTRAIYVGLGGPTFYDYRNKATRAKNDMQSSPNPILENAFGLSVFYDEIWFLCESLCPQSLRGHSRVKYADQVVSAPGHDAIRSAISAVLEEKIDEGCYDHGILSRNFKDYWDGVQRAGVYWWSDAAVDNHTHSLDVLQIPVNGNSNRFLHLARDLRIVEILRTIGDFDISLNSFGKNLHRILCPTQYHPDVESSNCTNLGSLVISAKVANCLDTTGPNPEVFDKIHGSNFVKDFRAYLRDKNVEDAGKCYRDVVNEIDNAVKRQIQKSALNARPIKGLANLAIDGVMGLTGIDCAAKAGNWYLSAVNGSPIGAAAFLLDLE